MSTELNWRSCLLIIGLYILHSYRHEENFNTKSWEAQFLPTEIQLQHSSFPSNSEGYRLHFKQDLAQAHYRISIDFTRAWITAIMPREPLFVFKYQ